MNAIHALIHKDRDRGIRASVGTCFAISRMISGLPMTKRIILGVARLFPLRTTAAVIEFNKQHQSCSPEAFSIVSVVRRRTAPDESISKIQPCPDDRPRN